MAPTFNWLWFDIETTGLDEHSDQLLEVAALVANDGPDGDFEVIDSVESVVLPASPVSFKDQTVRDMHTANGLLALIQQGQGLAISDVDDLLRAFVDQYLEDPKTKIVLAGGSVHFDLRWARKHLPRFSERLHYRVFDVSTLKAAARTWGPGMADIKSDKHRAMYDARASLKEAKAFLDLISA